MIEPVRKLRIFVAIAARLLPGVRCSTLCTVYNSPSWRMVIPGRTCVARISFAPDAYGILRQAVRFRCVPASRSPGGPGVRRPRKCDYRRLMRTGQRTAGGVHGTVTLRFTGNQTSRHNRIGSLGIQPMTKSIAKTFQARLERIDSPLKWVMIRIPFDAAKFWGKRGQLKVKGEINGFAFRTSLFPTGKGGHVLLVNKRMQAGAHAGAGSEASFHLEPDAEVRLITVPEELERALAEDRALRRWFDKWNNSTRNYISSWVGEPKSADARLRRADQIAERLLETMEAERELPQAIRVVFARDPRAYEGWKLMTPLRRRAHLFGIFYYRTPAARARRIAKAVQEARQV